MRFVSFGTSCFVTARGRPASSAAFFATWAGAGASAHVRGTGVSSRSPRALRTASWYAAIAPVPPTPGSRARPTVAGPRPRPDHPGEQAAAEGRRNGRLRHGTWVPAGQFRETDFATFIA